MLGISKSGENVHLLRGGFRPFNFENSILTYGLGVMAWTRTNNFRVVLDHARNTAHLRPWSKEWVKNRKLKNM